ncbi:hypothetical protein [Salinarimonas sp.]|uniref:tetratricopeptide repeat protein n=1 Tax=Salinarimonas sp. TaxID=2766526 RepID=UPI0032D8D26E
MSVAQTVSVLDTRFAADLLARPEEALRDLVAGKAALGYFAAGEPVDIVADLVAEGGEDYRAAVDRGAAAFLDSARRTLLQQKGASFRLGVIRLERLLAIVRRVLPRDTVVDLRRRYDLWQPFFANFVIDRSLDLRREFYRTLALSQDAAAEAGIEARGLMPLWLSLCAEAGGSYDESYLAVGLLGLRRMPLGEEFSANEDFVLQGLARWGARQKVAWRVFEREWRLVENAYPRSDDFWRERVSRVIAATEGEIRQRTEGAEETFPAAAGWREDLDLPAGEGGVRQLRGGGALEPPAAHDRQAILDRVGQPLSSVSSDIETLMRGHRRYADRTGDVFYLVRTACNIGMNLLRKDPGPERAARGAQAVALARLAFEYDPRNVYAWALLRDGLEHAGRLTAAERIGWEAIRRFPENPQWRTQLAKLLADTLDRPHEAAALLREARALFPYDPFIHNQLATILADDLGERAAAVQVLEDARAAGAANEATGDLRRKLANGRRLRGRRNPTAAVAGVEDTDDTFALPAAEARKRLFRLEAGLDGPDVLAAFLRTAEPDPYVTWAAARAGLDGPPIDTTFAIAFERALRDATPSRLKALVASTLPRSEQAIVEALAAADDRVVPFLRAKGRGRAPACGEPIHIDLDRPDILLLRDRAGATLSLDTARLQSGSLEAA